MLAYSYFSSLQKDITGAFYREMNVDSLGLINIRRTNASVPDLYRTAFKHMVGYFPDCRVINESSDTSLIKPGHPKENPRYCYDLFIKTPKWDAAHNYMREDLDRFFGVSSSLQKRTMKCLVLKRISAIDKISAKEGDREEIVIPGEISFNKLPIAEIIDKYGMFFPWVIIDETGYKGKINLFFPVDQHKITLPLARELLKKYDLELTEEVREMDVIVLKDRQNY
jgi:hypothetical protein